mmetsp:Transcript_48340/g.109630  ORF Transcript_48340/g.109630 Transcript_48340/m.109630 type:complete len:106 (+) Transcript_48340:91-408(+)|eukprot:CAMPEP_0204268210 /NCGR_PEP_ID=MMETSP0468-20130131/11442_1 /ASSEMBLY_ACC=CAM_ASM_000383 /TAXON_ID=2969 /ORGANISM="Oxyrrhis marina" /LENGTH=105 /DNA_ID=CAMNT_0051243457 /DNA_START=71 /DNA_END=388 /DNA_ORIENTATION=+
MAQNAESSVVILPSCLFHVGNTQREWDLLNLPPPSCSNNPGSQYLFQLRTKQSMGAPTGVPARAVGAPAAKSADKRAGDSGRSPKAPAGRQVADAGSNLNVTVNY